MVEQPFMKTYSLMEKLNNFQKKIVKKLLFLWQWYEWFLLILYTLVEINFDIPILLPRIKYSIPGL